MIKEYKNTLFYKIEMMSISIKITNKQYEEILYKIFIEHDNYYNIAFNGDYNNIYLYINVDQVSNFIDRLKYIDCSSSNMMMINRIIKKLERAVKKNENNSKSS